MEDTTGGADRRPDGDGEQDSAGPGSERLQALLSRAVEDQVTAERGMAEALGEVRTQLAQLQTGLARLEERTAGLVVVDGPDLTRALQALREGVVDDLSTELRETVADSEERTAAHVDEAVLALAAALFRRRNVPGDAGPPQDSDDELDDDLDDELDDDDLDDELDDDDRDDELDAELDGDLDDEPQAAEHARAGAPEGTWREDVAEPVAPPPDPRRSDPLRPALGARQGGRAPGPLSPTDASDDADEQQRRPWWRPGG